MIWFYATKGEIIILFIHLSGSLAIVRGFSSTFFLDKYVYGMNGNIGYFINLSIELVAAQKYKNPINVNWNQHILSWSLIRLRCFCFTFELLSETNEIFIGSNVFYIYSWVKVYDAKTTNSTKMCLTRENGAIRINLIILIVTMCQANFNSNLNGIVPSITNCQSMNACDLVKIISEDPACFIEFIKLGELS